MRARFHSTSSRADDGACVGVSGLDVFVTFSQTRVKGCYLPVSEVSSEVFCLFLHMLMCFYVVVYVQHFGNSVLKMCKINKMDWTGMDSEDSFLEEEGGSYLQTAVCVMSVNFWWKI